MTPAIGIADSQATVHAHLNGRIAYYHGKQFTSGVYVFSAIPNEGAYEAYTELESDPNITLLPAGLGALVSDAVVLKKLAKIAPLAALPAVASGAATVGDLRAALHGLGITHLFDPRLG